MSDAQKKQLIYRCPVCFARENDVVLRQKDDGAYYCVKCSFTGNEEEIQDMYRDMKKKYKLMTTRITLEELEQWDGNI